MEKDDVSLPERIGAFLDRLDAPLEKHPSLYIVLAGLVAGVFNKLFLASWTSILVAIATLSVLAFGFIFLSKEQLSEAGNWVRKVKLAFRNGLAFLGRSAVVVLVGAIFIKGVDGLLATEIVPEPTRPPPTDSSAPPPEASPDVTPGETRKPEPTATVTRARPTSTELQEVTIRASDLRGAVYDLYPVTSLEYAAAEPWDFGNVRLCSSARFQAPVEPAWRDSRLFDGDSDEFAASSSGTFYSEGDAQRWLDRVLEEIGRCNITLGPIRPRIAGEEVTLRFRSHVQSGYGRLNIDRVVVRVENVVLQVVVARHDGNNQAVVEAVARKCIARLVELLAR